jgi:hypothetical protein
MAQAAPADGPRLAVMQPYFFPYAGYYRLFAAADLFVLLDCVQFPRRGRVHRCEVQGPAGPTEWLTLPLARQDRAVRIRDLAFAAGAPAEMARRLARHPWIGAAAGPVAQALQDSLVIRGPDVTAHLEGQLHVTAGVLGLPARILRSSSLAIDPALRGQDRILALCAGLGATAYVNPPGGRALYHAADFARAGVALRFLPPWAGPGTSILHDLLQGDAAGLARAIRAAAVAEPA